MGVDGIDSQWDDPTNYGRQRSKYGDGDYPPDWDARRRAVYRRDDYACKRCGQQGGRGGSAELHAHHRTPLSRGGTNDIDNLVTLCSSCHNAAHDHDITADERSTGGTTTGTGAPTGRSDDPGVVATVVGGLIGVGALAVLAIGVVPLLFVPWGWALEAAAGGPSAAAAVAVAVLAGYAVVGYRYPLALGGLFLYTAVVVAPFQGYDAARVAVREMAPLWVPGVVTVAYGLLTADDAVGALRSLPGTVAGLGRAVLDGVTG